MKLLDRSAVVTGASKGIGREIALAFAREGARVVISYLHSTDAARSVVASIEALGGKALAVLADASVPGQVDRLVDTALSRFGKIDIWVNNAGADILTGPAPRLSLQERLERLLNIDVKGTVFACRAAAEVMRRQGSGKIINIAWDHIFTGMGTPEGELYALAKGAVWAYSKSLARSLAPSVQVNIIAPGWIETAWGKSLDPEIHARIAAGTPLKRWGQPADVAAAAVFLASTDADFITGHTLVVNGGVVMY